MPSKRRGRQGSAGPSSGKPPGPTLLQALPLRDRHRAQSLQGPARAAAPAGRPLRPEQRPAARGRRGGRLRDPQRGPLRELALFRKDGVRDPRRWRVPSYGEPPFGKALFRAGGRSTFVSPVLAERSAAPRAVLTGDPVARLRATAIRIRAA